MKSPVIKRTVYVNGRKTGICLEDRFWSTLKEIAHAHGATVSQTVTQINTLRRGGTLSGAIRLFVLDRVRGGRRQPLISAASFGDTGDGC